MHLAQHIGLVTNYFI